LNGIKKETNLEQILSGHYFYFLVLYDFCIFDKKDFIGAHHIFSCYNITSRIFIGYLGCLLLYFLLREYMIKGKNKIFFTKSFLIHFFGLMLGKQQIARILLSGIPSIEYVGHKIENAQHAIKKLCRGE
jgi:hypothetical protein